MLSRTDPIDPDDARRRAAEILAGKEYRSPTKPFLQRGLEWLGRRLAGLLDLLNFGGRGGAAGAVVGWIVVLAALAGLVLLIVWGVRRARRSPTGAADGAEETTISLRVDRPADEWRAEAADHAAAGRWREALRCRYRAVVADLADRGTLDAVPGRTTGDERQQVAERVPELGATFDGVAETFDRVVYGDEPAGPADVAALDELDRAVDATGRGKPR